MKTEPLKAPAMGQRYELIGLLVASAHQDHAEQNDGNDGANNANDGCVHFVLLSKNVENHILFIIGSRSRMMRTITGPTVTINRDGRTQKNIGKTSFMPTLAAFSSAFWRV
jgi:hypothetical protein